MSKNGISSNCSNKIEPIKRIQVTGNTIINVILKKEGSFLKI